MSKRRGSDEILFSLDAFLDVVTNVVGILVLVAVVSVLSSGNISVPSGATAMAAPRPSSARLLFECAGDELFFVDEEANGQRVLNEVNLAGKRVISSDFLVALLDDRDVGDATHRVSADPLAQGVAWVYTLRPEARGERAAFLDRAESAFQRQLDGLERGGVRVLRRPRGRVRDLPQGAGDRARARGLGRVASGGGAGAGAAQRHREPGAADPVGPSEPRALLRPCADLSSPPPLFAAAPPARASFALSFPPPRRSLRDRSPLVLMCRPNALGRRTRIASTPHRWVDAPQIQA